MKMASLLWPTEYLVTESKSKTSNPRVCMTEVLVGQIVVASKLVLGLGFGIEI